MVVIKLSPGAHSPPPSASGLGTHQSHLSGLGRSRCIEDTRPCTNLPSMCTARLHVRGSQAARLAWPARVGSVEEGGGGNVRWLKALRWVCLTVHSSSKRFGSAGGGPRNRISPIASWGFHFDPRCVAHRETRRPPRPLGGVRCSVGNHELPPRPFALLPPRTMDPKLHAAFNRNGAGESGVLGTLSLLSP
jgi:hypothetical protein